MGSMNGSIRDVFVSPGHLSYEEVLNRRPDLAKRVFPESVYAEELGEVALKRMKLPRGITGMIANCGTEVLLLDRQLRRASCTKVKDAHDPASWDAAIQQGLKDLSNA